MRRSAKISADLDSRMQDIRNRLMQAASEEKDNEDKELALLRGALSPLLMANPVRKKHG